jgi:hypothetical protein
MKSSSSNRGSATAGVSPRIPQAAALQLKEAGLLTRGQATEAEPCLQQWIHGRPIPVFHPDAIAPAKSLMVPSLVESGLKSMALAIDLSDYQAQALAEAAARLQISETDLAAAAVRDLIAQPADDFNAAAQRVLSKNAELYRRLA